MARAGGGLESGVEGVYSLKVECARALTRGLVKVLIIDDEEDIRSVAALSLGLLGGVEVVEAGSGMLGITMAATEKPDVILLDMNMPVMDGPATLKMLRETPATSAIPVIFLTARAMKNEMDSAKQMGAKGVLTKPFDPTALAAQVRAILESN
jgi:CheY-like chemotaxis protein